MAAASPPATAAAAAAARRRGGRATGGSSNMRPLSRPVMALAALVLALLPAAARGFGFVLPSPATAAAGRKPAAGVGRLAHHRAASTLLPSLSPAGAVRRLSVAAAAATTTADGVLEGAGGSGTGGSGKAGGLRDRLGAFYRFTRPHTIRGTILASAMGVLRCLIEHPKAFTLQPVPRALLGLLALLCGNVFIVGINQIYDVEIDKVNKPFLPLAAQRMSGRMAWALVVGACALGLAITKTFFSSLIFGMYSAGILAGALYSIPPFYFKRFPVVAAATIAFVRGFSLNFGVYYAVREALGIPFRWNPIVVFITRFMTVFAGVIAVSKDLPDTEGDAKHGVRTFATRVGVKNMARGASVVLFLNYLSAIAEGALNRGGAFRAPVMVGGHAVLALMLLNRFRKLNAESLAEIKGYYKFIWDLFYLEYLMYPFM